MVVDEKDAKVVQALQAEPVYLTPEQETHPWIDPDFRFHLTPVGYSRLEQEKAALEAAGYSVQINQRKGDRRVSMLLARGKEQWLCTLPLEYPLGMPRLFCRPNLEETYPLRQRPVWNSDLMIVDMLAAAQSQPDPLTSSVQAAVQPSAADELRRKEKSAQVQTNQQASWFLPSLAGLIGLVLGIFWGRRRRRVSWAYSLEWGG